MPHFHAHSWNVQGKGFEDIRTSWPCLGMDGFDVIGLQEVGGFSALTQPWKTEDCELDGGWIFYVTNPPLTHHAVSIGFPSRLIPHVIMYAPFRLAFVSRFNFKLQTIRN